jgi:hypothetical protein
MFLAAGDGDVVFEVATVQGCMVCTRKACSRPVAAQGHLTSTCMQPGDTEESPKPSEYFIKQACASLPLAWLAMAITPPTRPDKTDVCKLPHVISFFVCLAIGSHDLKTRRRGVQASQGDARRCALLSQSRFATLHPLHRCKLEPRCQEG